jgi:predicted transposase/invertase (TIGR01784 family)
MSLDKMNRFESDHTAAWNWMQFLRAKSEEEFEMIAQTNPMIKKAVGELKRLSADERARLLDESHEKYRRDWAARMDDARVEGEARGKLETAMNLLALGVTIELINQATGIPLGELEKLRGKKP